MQKAVVNILWQGILHLCYGLSTYDEEYMVMAVVWFIHIRQRTYGYGNDDGSQKVATILVQPPYITKTYHDIIENLNHNFDATKVVN